MMVAILVFEKRIYLQNLLKRKEEHGGLSLRNSKHMETGVKPIFKFSMLQQALNIGLRSPSSLL